MKLGLGTVQFGLGYGVSNTLGQPSLSEVEQILVLAREAGIEALDTAVAYGEAESVLGKLAAHTSHSRVISKVPAVDAYTPGCIGALLDISLGKLQRDTLDGLLLHRADDLFGPHGLAILAEMQALCAAGRVGKIGVSVYGPEQLEAMEGVFAPALVQLPASLLDQRFLQQGWLDKLQTRGVEVHIRSAFLQGLLLMEKYARPTGFNAFSVVLERYDGFCSRHALSPLQATLGFVRQLAANIVLVGVNSAAELTAILQAWQAEVPSLDEYAELACNDENLILPMNWGK